MRTLGAWAAPAAVLALVALPVDSARAQQVDGEAYGAYVSTPTTWYDKAPRATLPGAMQPDGAMAEAETDALNVVGALGTDLLTSVTTGAIGTDRATAQSVATVADVDILNGTIRADQIVAAASSTSGNGSAVSSADGSTFEDLVVNGAAVTQGDDAVAPNTRIDLPGVGYVVLNEQLRTGDGVGSSGLTVNMIHVVLQDALTGAKTGDIVVGSARTLAAR